MHIPLPIIDADPRHTVFVNVKVSSIKDKALFLIDINLLSLHLIKNEQFFLRDAEGPPYSYHNIGHCVKQEREK